METSLPKPYSLKKLSGFLGDDPKQVIEMIHLFLETIPPELALLKQAASLKDFVEISTISHRIKPSLDVFDLKNAMQIIRILELFSKNEQQQSQVSSLVDDLISTLNQALKIMQTELDD